MKRRILLAVIGDAGVGPGTPAWAEALTLGRLAVDHGYRIVCGGLRGVMEAACRGAHESAAYREGDTVGILPVGDPDEANPWVDIVLATHLDAARNTLIANADAVVAIGGGAGTLSEMAYAWQYKRLVIGLDVPGWSRKLAGQRIDQRVRYVGLPDDQVFGAANAAEALRILGERLPDYQARHLGFAARLAR